MKKPSPRWTVWHEPSDGVVMCRVRLDAGQYSFTAGREIRSLEELPTAASAVMNAILWHAIGKGWINSGLD